MDFICRVHVAKLMCFGTALNNCVEDLPWKSAGLWGSGEWVMWCGTRRCLWVSTRSFQPQHLTHGPIWENMCVNGHLHADGHISDHVHLVWKTYLEIQHWWVSYICLSSGWEGAKELGVFIFPIYSLFNVEPRSYLEFPNHQIVVLSRTQSRIYWCEWKRVNFFCNSSVAMPPAFGSFEFRFAYDGGRGGDI